MKKVISFSLYGSTEKYTFGAIENARLAKVFYPEWISRFYINNTVPKEIVSRLTKLDAEIIDMSTSTMPGVYWRFLPMDDKGVSVFISRDTDSRLSDRESKLVREWLDSGKALHTIHDNEKHKASILAGQWGFVNSYRSNFSMEEEILNFCKNRNFTYGDDQIFLEKLYNLYKENEVDHSVRPLFSENSVAIEKAGEGESSIGSVFDHKNKLIKNRHKILSANLRHSLVRLTIASYIGTAGEFIKDRAPLIYKSVKQIWVKVGMDNYFGKIK